MMTDKKPKVLILIPNLKGGTGKVITRLVSECLKSQWTGNIEICLYETEDLNLLPQDVCKVSLDAPLPKRLLKRGFQLGIYFSKISKILKKSRPDIVLSVGTYSNILTSVHHLFYKDYKLILSEHDYLSVRLKQNRIYSPMLRKLIKILYSSANRVLAPSKLVVEDLVGSFGIPKDHCEFIYNGVDVDQVKALSLEKVDGLPFDESFVVVTAGRLSKQKSYADLIQAFKIVRDRQKVKLLILGEGEEESNLKSLVRNLQISEDVIFLGYQDNPYKFMRVSNLFVLSSLWEGFGLVLVEAMACGLPIISTNCLAGPSEILEDGKYGLLAPVGNPRVLAEKIGQMIQNENLRKSFSEKSLQRASNFGTTKMGQAYCRLFEKMMNPASRQAESMRNI